MNFAELNLIHRGNQTNTLNMVRRAIRMGYDTVVISIDVADFSNENGSKNEEQPPKKKKRKSQASSGDPEEVASDFLPDPYLVDASQLDLSSLEQSGRKFRQLSRITVTLRDSTAVHRFFHHPKLKLFDVVAVRFEDEQILATLQRKGDCVDLISIDADSGRIGWLYKQKIVQACITAGLSIELAFSKALTSTENRRQFLTNARKIMDVTRGGRGVVLSSGAEEMISVRAPYDVANLSTLFGVDPRHGRKFVSANAKAMLLRAQSRRTIKGAIHVTSEHSKIPTADGKTSKETLEALNNIPEFMEQLKTIPVG